MANEQPTLEIVAEQPEVRHRDLREKAINIKGKRYVIVSDRVIFFNEEYPEGSIVTEILSPLDAEVVVMKATISPDQKRFFVGHSQAKWGEGYINKTAALENAETSAVGRALALMGIGVLDSIASVDEINKANNTAAANGEAKIADHETAFEQREEGEKKLATFQQDGLKDLAKQHGKTEAQLIAWMMINCKVDRIEHVLRRDFDKLKAFVIGREPMQDTLQSSVAALQRTSVSRMAGEDDTVSVEGLLGSVAQKLSKAKKPYLSIKMQDGMELSDWHIDHESTLKGYLGKKVEFLAKVKGVGDKTYYNVDSLEIRA